MDADELMHLPVGVRPATIADDRIGAARSQDRTGDLQRDDDRGISQVKSPGSWLVADVHNLRSRGLFGSNRVFSRRMHRRKVSQAAHQKISENLNSPDGIWFIKQIHTLFILWYEL